MTCYHLQADAGFAELRITSADTKETISKINTTLLGTVGEKKTNLRTVSRSHAILIAREFAYDVTLKTVYFWKT